MAARSSTADAPPNPFTAALAEEARDSGLRYTFDTKAGIRRRKRGGGFEYLGANGGRVKDTATLARLPGRILPVITRSSRPSLARSAMGN